MFFKNVYYYFFSSLELCSFWKLRQLHDRFKFVLRGKPSRQCRCFDKCSPFPTSYYGGDFTELNIVHNALHCWLATPAGSRHCVCKVSTVSDVTKLSLISKLLFGRMASIGQTRIWPNGSACTLHVRLMFFFNETVTGQFWLAVVTSLWWDWWSIT